MNIIEKLNWRYAVKKFDPNKKVSDKDFDMLIEAARLSPSSYGLQPWKFIVVKDEAVRKQLSAAAYDQPQITEASHFVVFCSVASINEDYVTKYIESVAKTRNQTVDSLDGYKNSLTEFVNGESLEDLDKWSSQQPYIALGMLLTAAAINNIDACPMGGFEKDKFDEILGLKKLGIKSQVLCAIGYRADDDIAATRKKVRFDKKDVVIEIVNKD